MELWAADAARDGRGPPFGGGREFQTIIDLIEGGAEWKWFEVKYNRELPDGNVLNWMTQPLKVYYCDPKTVLHNMLNVSVFIFNPIFNHFYHPTCPTVPTLSLCFSMSPNVISTISIFFPTLQTPTLLFLSPSL